MHKQTIKIFFISLLVLGINSLKAQDFSDSTVVSILIASPGPYLYNAFGHSGLRVNDRLTKTDIVFDFGVFDFNTPNFYGKFIRGKLLYQLAIRSYRQYWDSYGDSSQEVKEYKVNLNPSETQMIVQALVENYQPENREYLYDFFYDNCATRIRDLLEDASGDKVILPLEAKSDFTLRDLLHHSLQPKPWSAFGIDIILGLEADRIADNRKRVFIPYWLTETLEKYRIQRTSGKQPLLSEPEILRVGEPLSFPPFWRKPGFIVSLICSLILFGTIFFSKHWIGKLLDYTVFLIVGLAGCFILFLWFGTDHMATKDNLNLFWLNPLYLLLLPLLAKHDNRLRRWLILLLMSCCLVVIVGNGWLWPQYVHPAFYPILGLLFVRLFFNLRKEANAKPLT